ncbi:adenylate/guanylate cyclase domain-containing protein [Albimonas sp. CAU 1670]|uniref:adenylate/guanylate cyclase domain-containing protein n=1 Tax=Albimonas sp. CAU 1670 TaxID=3032599 RepID=UPI0023DB994C|nr:adenylate/guanylate cyclase domain-containing protein [Albimonas sp. CAU 1670]MDF2234524.1 adenylate/guanylate cyclase domain-containing protein [Albimonas sp. CAU 1670]
MKRRLTTIFYADAVRFGAQMEADEAATLQRLRRARAVMREQFAAHDGREVNTWGDAVIAEFASVVEAVRCAVAVQESLATLAPSEPDSAQMRFRIGINLGDVMAEGDDLYGDGVNVAERLQGQAEPGGVMVSGTVRELAHKQLAVGFDFAGDLEVKSLQEPVPGWRVRMARRNDPAPEAAGAASDDAGGVAWDLPERGVVAEINRWAAWGRAQPRKVRRAAAFILFFLALNVLGGLSTPWFIFPSLPFALYILRHRDPRVMPWRFGRAPAP